MKRNLMASNLAHAPRNRMTVWVLALGLVIGLTVGAVAGAEEVDRQEAFSADGTVVISNLAGSIVVTGWERNEIKVTGTLDDQVEKFHFDVGKKKAKIEVEYPRNIKGRIDGSDLEIMVPRGCKVDVSTVSADIEIEDVTGPVFPETVSGDIRVTGTPEEVDAESVSGEIELKVECNDVRAHSVSGDLLLDGVSGDVEAETVSGEIGVRGGSFERLRADAVSGDIRFAGGLSGSGRFSFNSHSGDIVLLLPADVSAEFDIETFSGDIDNDFGPEGKRTSKYTPGKELEFSTGGGEAQVRISTFSGDVELLKK